ncbi:hypothetical protein F8B43_1348 [Methylorubrum populi]|uniref:Uncharacterized protein n=1 Tax=Methylorubrum populi TaxID=223967 RepID=A0A833MY62_9HYPH|nr:hypothetical protein F8B43_1348 [Methylorubrum populi]
MREAFCSASRPPLEGPSPAGGGRSRPTATLRHMLGVQRTG